MNNERRWNMRRLVYVVIAAVVLVSMSVFVSGSFGLTGKTLWNWHHCSDTDKCPAGEGDCDTDSQCLTGQCSQNVGANYGQSRSMDVCECTYGKTWDGDSCETPTNNGNGGIVSVELECITGVASEDSNTAEGGSLSKIIYTSTANKTYQFYDVFGAEVLYAGIHGAPALTCLQSNGGWVLTGCNSANADAYGNEQRMINENTCVGEYGGGAFVSTRCCRIVEG